MFEIQITQLLLQFSDGLSHQTTRASIPANKTSVEAIIIDLIHIGTTKPPRQQQQQQQQLLLHWWESSSRRTLLLLRYVIHPPYYINTCAFSAASRDNGWQRITLIRVIRYSHRDLQWVPWRCCSTSWRVHIHKVENPRRISPMTNERQNLMLFLFFSLRRRFEHLDELDECLLSVLLP